MITFNCSCGQKLQVEDDYANRQVRCPKCQGIATAPPPQAIEVLEVIPVMPQRIEPAPKYVKESRPGYSQDEWDDVEDRPRRQRDDYEEDDDWYERDRPRRRARPQTSGKALAGMIFGLATFPVPVFCAIPAVLLGILGLVDIKRNPARLTGAGLAITGIVAGLLGNVSLFGYFTIYSGIRTSSQRVELQRNMKMLGIAMHNYHDANRALPAAGFAGKFGALPPNVRPNLSWRVALLPYIEQGNLYNQFNFDEPWDGPNNIKLLPLMPKIYAPLGRQPAEPHTTYMQVFTGPNTPFRGLQGMRLVGFTDGTSNTILLAEAGEAVPWTKPADIAFDMNGPLPKLGALDSRSFMVVMADGSTRLIKRGNDQGLRLAICPDDGQPLPPEWEIGR